MTTYGKDRIYHIFRDSHDTNNSAETHDYQYTELAIRRVNRDGETEVQISVTTGHRKRKSGRFYEMLGGLTLTPDQAKQMSDALLILFSKDSII